MIISPECEVNTVRCAGPMCDKIKGAQNHWFAVALVGPEHNAFVSVPLGEAGKHEILRDAVVLTTCGSACAQKMYEKYLATGAF